MSATSSNATPPKVSITPADSNEEAVLDESVSSPPEVMSPTAEDSRQGRSLRKRLSLSRATKGLKRMMRSSHSTPRPVLEYYDVCLRQEDIDNLRPGQWLQDSNIEFFYEWMEREKLPPTSLQTIFLLRPSIGFLIASIVQQGGVVDESLLPTGFLDAKYVFVPVTDNVDPTKAGGSHWSLLLVGIEEKTAWYLDSLPTTGTDKMTDARCYAKAFNQVFECQFELVFTPVPKQANGSDCGIHVCMETDILLGRLRLSPDAQSQPLDPSLENQSMNATAYRESLQRLIHDMVQYRGKRIGKIADIAVSPDRRSSSRSRPSIDQRLDRPEFPEKIPE